MRGNKHILNPLCCQRMIICQPYCSTVEVGQLSWVAFQVMTQEPGMFPCWGHVMWNKRLPVPLMQGEEAGDVKHVLKIISLSQLCIMDQNSVKSPPHCRCGWILCPCSGRMESNLVSPFKIMRENAALACGPRVRRFCEMKHSLVISQL